LKLRYFLRFQNNCDPDALRHKVQEQHEFPTLAQLQHFRPYSATYRQWWWFPTKVPRHNTNKKQSSHPLVSILGASGQYTAVTNPKPVILLPCHAINRNDNGY